MTRRMARQQDIEGKHDRSGNGEKGRKGEHPQARLKDEENTGKSGKDRKPSAPSDPLAQYRPGEGSDDQWIACEQGQAFDQPDQRNRGHHHEDLRRQKDTPSHLEQRLAGSRHRPDSALAGGIEGHHEHTEEPVSEHDNDHRVVFDGKVLGDAVLTRENEGGEDHQADPEAVVHPSLCSLFSRPRSMWRFRPKPPTRSTENPAAASARFTRPALV